MPFAYLRDLTLLGERHLIEDWFCAPYVHFLGMGVVNRNPLTGDPED